MVRRGQSTQVFTIQLQDLQSVRQSAELSGDVKVLHQSCFPSEYDGDQSGPDGWVTALVGFHDEELCVVFLLWEGSPDSDNKVSG